MRLFHSVLLIFIVLIIPIEAISDEYSTQWKSVEEHMQKQRPKSAIEIIEKIYKQARSEHNEQQIIKSTCYRIGLSAQLDENSELQAVSELKQEISTTTSPLARSLFENLLGEVYWNYYLNNSWKFSERTQTQELKTDDFRTWDAKTLRDSARYYYLSSLNNPDILKNSMVKDYGEITTKGKESDMFRPTIYDILVHKVIEFLQQSQSLISDASPELTDLSALSPLDEFIKNSSNVSKEIEKKALEQGNNNITIIKLFKDILKFHRTDKELEALIDADILRLQFGRSITANEEKDSIYLTSLQKIANKFSTSPSSVYATYLIAQEEFNQENYPRTMELCNSAIKLFPKSRGGINCKALQSQILQKELAVSIEKIHVPDQEFITAVTTRNLSKLYFRIVKTDNTTLIKKSRIRYINGDYQKDKVKKLLELTTVEKWEQTLPISTDYRSHTVDILSPKLPFGEYVLLVSPDENFSLDNNTIAFTSFTVTRFSLQSQSLKDGSIIYYVLDAQNGKPISGVSAKIVSEKYDYNTRASIETVEGTEVTDANGTFLIKAGRLTEKQFRIELSLGKDFYSSNNDFFQYQRYPEQDNKLTLFFTDRQLYRPGQTIYFKGIIYKNNNEQGVNEVLKNVKTTVQFFNTNSKEIAKLELRTNEFGSVSGSFIAPNNGLLGKMSIRNETGSQYFRVEEYKRPKFEVVFNTAKGNIELEKMVTITGKAVGFAGTNIAGATVQYHVTRTARFPYYRRGIIQRNSQSKEISHGTIETNALGEFSIEFPTIPDKSINKKSLPVFQYLITADVTDINGETHSSQTNVSAGYVSLELEVSIASISLPHYNTPRLLIENEIETVYIPDFVTNLNQNITITSKNINNSPIPARCTLLIQELKQPERKEILRRRLLAEPDQFLITKELFISKFPYDSYKKDYHSFDWSVASTIESKEFHIDSSGSFITGTNKKLKPGMYRITISSVDISGEPIEVISNIVVYDSTSLKPPVRFPMSYIPITINCQPGENATFLYGTSFKSASVLYQLEFRGEIIEQKRLEFSDELRQITIPIVEKYRGGLSAHLTFVHDGRLYSTNVNINVKWKNKELTIETSTFRDKLTPGEKEQWRLTIKNNEDKPQIAEMVARLYDASLDAISTNKWINFRWSNNYSSLRLSNNSFSALTAELITNNWNKYYEMQSVIYNRLNLGIINNSIGHRGRYSISTNESSKIYETQALDLSGTYPTPENQMSESNADALMPAKKSNRLIMGYGEIKSKTMENTDDNNGNNDKNIEDLKSVKVRSNFNETAFYYPQLMTDSSGSVIVNFTIPEALTRWRMTAFAHTPEMQTGEIERTVITQKDLMIEPNMPRFLRSGDTIILPSKITNLTDKQLVGAVELTILDAFTMKPVGNYFGLTSEAIQSFTANQNSAVSVSWKVVIPDSFQAIIYRIVAKSGNFSDGEEAPIPVLPNWMLVTETLPLWITNSTGKQHTKTFEFTKLKESGKSPTLRNQKLTLEMTSNPAWYAIQALPMLMEFPHECSEQTFNRFYANSIASFLVNTKPKIKRIFERWKESPESLLSNLEKNQELKSLLLEETPWVMQGQNETERKKRVALLFDLNQMTNQLQHSLEKLSTMQQPSGGFGWFTGMNESNFITNYILAGFGHLQKMGIDDNSPLIKKIISNAIRYSDRTMNESYLLLKSQKDFKKDNDYNNYEALQYIYARSYYTERKVDKQYAEAFDFWLSQADKYWQTKGLMSQAMIALALHRFGEKSTSKEIVSSINERSFSSEELGMYWKENESGWMWYNSPIETQSLLIEAYNDVLNDSKSIELMKVWLLKQKQVQDWKTTKATAEACYALLRQGGDWLESNEQVAITIGGKKLDISATDEIQPEAGSGYFKTSWNKGEISPSMGQISLSKTDKGIAWGGLYWQYYEQLNNITTHSSPLSLRRKLYRRITTVNGFELSEITSKTQLKVGDVLVIKLEVKTDRNMEFIHLKDMRGAGFEQLTQLSGYKWQDGLGYYQSPRDASMNFFIGWLPKGIYVLEYPLRVTHDGTFSMGISTIQSMYAPEFSSHSAGNTIKIWK